MRQRFLIYDVETRSECDLKKCGAYEYARHPSTLVFCVSWCIGTLDDIEDAPVVSWSPTFGGPVQEFLDACLDKSTMLVAHNSAFERYITNYVLSRMLMRPELQSIGPERFICTASLAASLALPRSLEEACNAFDLGVEKDMEGRRLILKYTKPRRETKNNKAKWHNSRKDLARIVEYCEKDIHAERALFLKAIPLSPKERAVWLLDQKINTRGVTVDRELVRDALALIAIEKERIENTTRIVSKGEIESTTQRDATLQWLRKQGVKIENLQAGTIKDLIASGQVEGPALSILRARQAASKSSTAKYESFEARSRFDGRVRDNLIYYGASTGRFSGSGVQLQNLPRPVIKDTDTLAEIIKQKDLELIRLIYGDPMGAFSSALRSCIIPSDGHELYVADYNAIEVRVLFWLAGHTKGVEAFLKGRDLYVEMAAKIYRKDPFEVTKEERHLGKTVILGAGYGLGVDKFFESCKNAGMQVTEELARDAINSYRETHWPVKKLWDDLNRACVSAVAHGSKAFKAGHVTYFVEGDFLFCELPSGRRLAYYRPEIKQEMTPWGEAKAMVSSWATNSMTRKWEKYKIYGGLLSENITQAVARDLMVEAMLRIEDAGYKILVSVHDELISEKEIDAGNIDEYCSLMSALPSWANGCPVKTEGWAGSRYRK